MKKIVHILIPLMPLLGTAQIVQIPDTGFERNLIDEGHDSDGTINGKILKSDALSVVNFGFTNATYSYVSDITGLNEFSNLETLKIGLGNIINYKQMNITIPNLAKLRKLYIDSYSLQSLNLTNLSGLLELKIENTTIDLLIENLIQKLDFSNSPNFDKLHVKKLYSSLENINLRNNKANSVSLIIEDGTKNTLCIEVDDYLKATNKQAPYNNWSVTINGTTPYSNFYFSDICTLSVEKFVKENFKIYPNPTSEYVVIDQNDTENVQLESVQIIDNTGKWIRSVKENFNYINVSDLASGTYLFVIQTNKGNKVEKVVIN